MLNSFFVCDSFMAFSELIHVYRLTLSREAHECVMQYNFVHELGIWEKQSSFLFQAKSCQTLVMGNMCVLVASCFLFMKCCYWSDIGIIFLAIAASFPVL